MAIAETYNYLVAVIVGYCVCCTASLVVTATHYYHAYHRWKEYARGQIGGNTPRTFSPTLRLRARSSSTSKTLQTLRENEVAYLTTICIVGYLAHQLNGLCNTLSTFRLIGKISCNAVILTGATTLYIGKSAMYALFVARLDAFRSSRTLQYSDRSITGMYLAIGLIFVVVLATIFVSVEGKRKQLGFARDGERVGGDSNRELSTCIVLVPRPLLMVVLVFDYVASIAFMVLFIKPMRKLLAKMKTDPDTHRVGGVAAVLTDAQLRTLPLKYTVTCCVAVISTMASFVFLATTNAPFLVAVDACVNLMCVLLMSPSMNKYYWLLCKPLVKCLASNRNVCCFYSQPDPSFEEAIDSVADFYTKKGHSRMSSHTNTNALSPTEAAVTQIVDRVPRKSHSKHSPVVVVDDDDDKQQI